MPDLRQNGADRLRKRRWTFAGCVFDESNWTLTAGERRIAIETKPLEMLRELLLHAGSVVTKDELLDKIWPDVTVVEASLPTAVHKLRHALGDDRRDRCIIETVPGIGYRLAVPATVEELGVPVNEAPRPIGEIARSEESRFRHWGFLSRGLGALAVIAILGSGPAVYKLAFPVAAAAPVKSYTQREAANALRKLDVGAIEDMLAAGWDPNKPFDDQGNAAINYVLNECEWNRTHDQEQMLLMVRTLIDGGARIDRRNVWGDTPYSIAKAVRYCGPNHLVTRSLRTMCYAGYKPYGDRCLASYELERRNLRRKS